MVEQRQTSSSSLSLSLSTSLVTDSYTSLKFVRYKIELSLLFGKKKEKNQLFKSRLVFNNFLGLKNQPTQTKHNDQNIYPTKGFCSKAFLYAFYSSN